MSEFVRIQTENGYETTVSRTFAESTPGVVIIDGPATNRRGIPQRMTRRGGRPALPRTTVDNEAAKKAASRTTIPAVSSPAPHDGVAVNTPQEAQE